MDQLGIVLLTKNEEKRIRGSLDHLLSITPHIVIVDDESTDQTVSIIREEYDLPIIVSRSNRDLAKQRNLGADHLQTEWVLQMDTDEIIPDDTITSIQKAIASKQYNSYWINRLNFFLDTAIRHANASQHINRMYRKEKARYDEPGLHEFLRVDGDEGRIDEFIYHYPFEGAEDIVLRALHYTEFEAEQICAKSDRISLKEIRYRLTFKSVKLFWKMYVKNKGYKDGLAGLIWCVCNVIGPQILWMKVLQKAKRKGILIEH